MADVSRGDGADFSTFHIIKLETLEIVGEYQGKAYTRYVCQHAQSVWVENLAGVCWWLKITILDIQY